MPTAVVTGSNSGIGHAFASLLLKQNYKVYAIDKDNGEKLKSLAKDGAITAEVDVTSPESIQKWWKDEILKEEKVDLFLNIAGIAFPHSKDALSNSTLSTFQSTFAVNTFAPFLLVQLLLPNIISANPPGKIGIISSRVGSIGDNSSGGSYAYRSSKAAVNSIGKSLSVDLKPKGVAVMLLHPGYVRTGLLPDSEVPKDVKIVEPEQAARELWENVISKKGLEETGGFWHREGYELPW